MTDSSKGFHNHNPCKRWNNVRVANGSLAPISGIGYVNCIPNIALSSVLHVPNLPINLLSVNSLTKDLNYKGIFVLIFATFRTFE